MVDQYFLFLNKIKLGSFDGDFADKFGVSVSTVSRIVIKWAKFLYVILGNIPLWSTGAMINKKMPPIFKQFPNTKVILDYTKLFL